TFLSSNNCGPPTEPHSFPTRRSSDLIEETKKRGTFRVGVTQAPPWFSKDPKTGQWSSGLGISMGKAMADALGAKLETEARRPLRSEEHTSELQSRENLVCRLLLEKKK